MNPSLSTNLGTAAPAAVPGARSDPVPSETEAPRKRARGLSIRPRITFSPGTFEHEVFAPLSDAERRARLEFYVRLGLEVAAGRFKTAVGAAVPAEAAPLPVPAQDEPPAQVAGAEPVPAPAPSPTATRRILSWTTILPSGWWPLHQGGSHGKD